MTDDPRTATGPDKPGPGFVRDKWRRASFVIRQHRAVRKCRREGHVESWNEWGYSYPGDGLCELFCARCGAVVRRVPLSEMPFATRIVRGGGA